MKTLPPRCYTSGSDSSDLSDRSDWSDRCPEPFKRDGTSHVSRFTFHASSFTLIEVLLALAICAIVLVAINAVFATAVHLRDRTAANVNQTIPVNQALDIVSRDLKSVAGPHGFLAGDFKCDAQTMGQNMGLSASGGNGLDFFTSTGVISESSPFGNLQEVYYQLMPAAKGNRALGMDFVRCVNRNLLATTLQTPDIQILLTDIESADFECYDGSMWRNWDTSVTDTNLPTAVRIRLQQAVDPNLNNARPPALELIVPLTTQTRSTNS